MMRSALVAAIVVAGMGVAPMGCGKPSAPTQPTSTGATPTPSPSTGSDWTSAFASEPIETRDHRDGVIVRVHRAGAGDTAQAGDTVVIDFVARYRGPTGAPTEFDSSEKRGGPLSVPLAEGSAVPGLLAGLEGLRMGDVARIEIPPSLAYGASGRGPIPGNAPLEFDVHVVSIERANPAP